MKRYYWYQVLFGAWVVQWLKTLTYDHKINTIDVSSLPDNHLKC
jgi:hypothetical protein